MSAVDPFTIFDSEVPPPSEPVAGNDPFDCFGAPAEHQPAKRPCSSPSPVLPLIRRFVAAHVGDAIADLRAASSSAAATLASHLSDAADHLAAVPAQFSGCRSAAESVADAAWSTLTRDGAWPHASWREAYVLAQLALAAVCSACDNDTDAALRCLDRAFILGGPTQVFRDCVEILDEPKPQRARRPTGPLPTADINEDAPAAEPWRRRLEEVRRARDGAPSRARLAVRAVERQPCPPTAQAFRAARRGGAPLLFEGVADGWPALEQWQDFGWLRDQYGARLVPVELGSLASATGAVVGATGAAAGATGAAAGATGAAVATAAATDGASMGGATSGGATQPGAHHGAWREKLMPLADFVDTFLMASEPGTEGHAAAGEATAETAGEAAEDAQARHPHAVSSARAVVGYLAQHNLFEQIPRLRRDFAIPALLAGGVQHMHAWLGPEGTVTPLHFDSYDNVLVQVVGHKLVYLERASNLIWTPRLACKCSPQRPAKATCLEPNLDTSPCMRVLITAPAPLPHRYLFDSGQTPRLDPKEGGGNGVDAQGNVSPLITSDYL